MAVFAVEKFAAAYPEASELLKLHWDEVAPYKDLFTLNPDLERYQRLEDQGSLCVITAREEGTLIGYIVMVVAPNLHYKQALCATDDIHFVHPDYRKGSLGSRLIVTAVALMKKAGVKVMFLRTKVANSHGLLFERLGFEPLDMVYSMRLDKDD